MNKPRSSLCRRASRDTLSALQDSTAGTATDPPRRRPYKKPNANADPWSSIPLLSCRADQVFSSMHHTHNPPLPRIHATLRRFFSPPRRDPGATASVDRAYRSAPAYPTHHSSAPPAADPANVGLIVLDVGAPPYVG